jgi:DNA invertase Pin-like site-specific DNA recombinase
MAVARAKGRLKGRQRKLTVKQQKELRGMHASGDYTISDFAELFKVSRPTVYRTNANPPPHNATESSRRSQPTRAHIRCFLVSWTRYPGMPGESRNGKLTA